MGFKDFLKKVNQVADEGQILEKERKSGVYIIDEKLVYKKGFRLYDGNLIDYRGKVIQNWNYLELGNIKFNKYFAQKNYEGVGWGVFDLNGNNIWIKSEPIHHEIFVSDDKKIYTFSKECHKYKGRQVDFDKILKYDLDGILLFEFSIWDNLKAFQKFHKKLVLDFPKLPFIPDFAKRKKKSPWGGFYCYYHLNSLQVLPENDLGKVDKRFQKGNLLISFRHGSLVFILDKDNQDIVWSLAQFDIEHGLEGQHCPRMLNNGNLLIFDNGRYRNWSRIIELNPKTKRIVWEYKNADFFTLSQGFVEVLPNGNYLITQSEEGRSFEISSKERKIVWEFYHPKLQDLENSKYKKNFGKRKWIYRMRFVEKV